MTTPQLSVVIPAFNESVALDRNLPSITSYLENHGISYEIVVSDDGSWDATRRVAQAYTHRGVRVLGFDKNRGKGAALRSGVLASRGRQVLLADADFSMPISDLPRLQNGLKYADLALGSRATAQSQILRRQPWYRQLMGRVFRGVVRLAGVHGIRDTQCGFKLLRGDLARELFRDLTTKGFAFDVELIWLAQQRGYRVVEVGIRWADSEKTTVRPGIDSLFMLLEVVHFRWHGFRRRRERQDAELEAGPSPSSRSRTPGRKLATLTPTGASN